ncbi:MAG: penicillin-binding protein 2, partial [Gammaproteobacteria bacterium]|nr:penicillin-binding protein 2 [Gammaproteobacteria bacterium]
MSRTIIAGIGAVALAGVLIAQMVHLQIKQHDHYSVRSKDNRIRVLPLPPTRGLITDREGRALAENLPTYRLELIPEQIDDLETTLAEVKALLPLSELEEKRFEKAWK